MENQEIKVGHILRSSWGYSMTFNEFYHVVGKRGKTILIVDRLRNKKIDGCGFTGNETVDMEAPPVERVELRLKRGRKDLAKTEHGIARVCDPKKSYYYNTMD